MKLSDLNHVIKKKEKREQLLAAKAQLQHTGYLIVQQVQGSDWNLSAILSSERHASGKEAILELVNAELTSVEEELAELGVTLD